MTRVRDAVVVGAGPAGLGFAIAAAARGLDVAVLERRSGPIDKACGEGLLPAGVRVLERLGALDLLASADASPIREIRWMEATPPPSRSPPPRGVEGRGERVARDAVATARLPPPGGLGIRRTALSSALLARAREVGVEIMEDAEVLGHRRERDRIVALARGGRGVAARLLVAADGLASPTRRREGLDLAPGPRARFGLRRHFALAPWSDAVEVHFADGAEAYVTPAGARRVGVAILFERSEAATFERLLARFPAVAARLAAAEPDSEVRGGGPFARRSRSRIADRLALLGDAAGYVDAVTGEGLGVALACAEDLATLLPGAIARGAGREELAPYEAAWRRRFRPYAAFTRIVLGLTRRPALRRRVLSLAASRPWPFEKVVAAAVG